MKNTIFLNSCKSKITNVKLKKMPTFFILDNLSKLKSWLLYKRA